MLSFVASIGFLIIKPSFLSLILGWDGLSWLANFPSGFTSIVYGFSSPIVPSGRQFLYHIMWRACISYWLWRKPSSSLALNRMMEAQDLESGALLRNKRFLISRVAWYWKKKKKTKHRYRERSDVLASRGEGFDRKRGFSYVRMRYTVL